MTGVYGRSKKHLRPYNLLRVHVQCAIGFSLKVNSKFFVHKFRSFGRL